MRNPFFFLLLTPFIAVANQCPTDRLAPYTWGNTDLSQYMTVDADHSSVSQKKVHFSGNVVAKRGQETFHADAVDYDRQAERVQSDARLVYGTPHFAVEAQQVDYSLKNQNGQFNDLQYYLTKHKVIGQAKQLDVDRIANTEKLSEATYSTCPRLRRKWHIKAEEIYLDHNKGVGTTKHTTFHIGSTPVLYLPYFSFPLNDERKTGFLTPSGNLSETRGLDITTPFYLNIAPNQDATIYPRLMSKRGFMLGTEYRYLLPNIAGKVAGTYLPNDLKAGDNRWSFRTEHRYQPNETFYVTAGYQRVSDKLYLEHFENTLDLSNTNFLESHLTANYRPNPNFRLSANFKDYQIANSNYGKADKPYSVLPRLRGQGRWRWDNGIILDSDSEITHFDKDNTVSGIRFDQKLALSYLYENSYAFVKPTAIYRFSQYQLRDQADGIPSSITRAIPTFSIDSGLFFDRQTNWFNHDDVTQTLEPRLFYLRTPYRDQSDIPDFDTASISSSYDAMFLNNRFNGKDRIGDANQLTTAISTRFIDNKTGKELAKLSIGQIQYFEDRRVSLLGTVANETRSSLIAEGNLRINDHLSARGLAHRNIDTKHTEKSLLGVTYSPDVDKAISFSHLYDEDYYKQLDFSGVWRVDDNWRTFWRWNYSIEYSKSIDIIAGVEYADCCWGVRVLARQQRDKLTGNDEAENSVFLEFALKGLGNVGSDTTKLLRDIIPNYRSISYEEE